MKIVNRVEFLKLPSGTVFVKIPPQTEGSYNLGPADDVSIKWDTCAGEDFVTQTLVPHFEGWYDSDDWSNVMIGMLEGQTSPPVDYDCAGRDGLFDRDQLFMIWEDDDLSKMIALLQTAQATGRTK